MCVCVCVCVCGQLLTHTGLQEKTGAYTVAMESQENQFKYYVREDFNPAYRSKVTTHTTPPHAPHT
jgi:hypothetical protein